VDQLGVAHGDAGSAAVAHGFEDQEIAQRLGDTQSAGDGVGIVPKLAARLAALERADDGLAAFPLHNDHLLALGPHPAQGLHVFEGLAHADHADAAAGGIEYYVRQLPAHLLGEFIAHRLLAFDAVGLFERADIEPALGFAPGVDDLGAVADEAVDECDFG